MSPTLRAMGHHGSHANAGGQVAVAFNPQAGGKQTSLGFRPGADTTGTLESNQIPAVAFGENVRGELRTMDIAAALQTQGGKPGQGYPAAMQGSSVRRLTPKECCRLQGFPDEYLDIIYRGKPAADGPKYKALGNSMAVPVMRWIGERIEMVERLIAESEAA
jgi:DNA (cytosine-5)-methyltransferase 1